MLIAGVVCGVAAVVCAAFGLWSLLRPGADVASLSTRSVAPTQLAAAVMLAAGGAVALAVPRPVAVALVSMCVVGAVAPSPPDLGRPRGIRCAARRPPAAVTARPARCPAADASPIVVTTASSAKPGAAGRHAAGFDDRKLGEAGRSGSSRSRFSCG